MIYNKTHLSKNMHQIASCLCGMYSKFTHKLSNCLATQQSTPLQLKFQFGCMFVCFFAVNFKTQKHFRSLQFPFQSNDAVMLTAHTFIHRYPFSLEFADVCSVIAFNCHTPNLHKSPWCLKPSLQLHEVSYKPPLHATTCTCTKTNTRINHM